MLLSFIETNGCSSGSLDIINMKRFGPFSSGAVNQILCEVYMQSLTIFLEVAKPAWKPLSQLLWMEVEKEVWCHPGSLSRPTDLLVPVWLPSAHTSGATPCLRVPHTPCIPSGAHCFLASSPHLSCSVSLGVRGSHLESWVVLVLCLLLCSPLRQHTWTHHDAFLLGRPSSAFRRPRSRS